MAEPIDVNALLQVMRLRSGAQQKAEIAVKSGITPSLLTAWERRRYRPTPLQLLKVASAYGISIVALLGEVGARAAARPKAPALQLQHSGSRGPTDLAGLEEVLVEPEFVEVVRLLKVVWKKREEFRSKWDGLVENVVTFAERVDPAAAEAARGVTIRRPSDEGTAVRIRKAVRRKS